MDYSEKWGRSVDDAVDLALADLKLTRDEVNVIVLEEPSKGFFGLGAKLALVRVEKKKAEKPVVKEEEPAPASDEEEKKIKVLPLPCEVEGGRRKPSAGKSEKPAGKGNGRKRNHGGRKDRSEEPLPPVDEDSLPVVRIREKPENLVEIQETPALDFLKSISENMGLELDIKAFENEEYLYVDINGKDAGTIIGKRGQTLDAVQYLTSLVVNKEKEKYTRVIVDAENYRERREQTLEQLAKRLADKVRRSGKSVRLEPMNPYERKVIHSTLQHYPGVSTRSEGEEPYRRVIIERK